MWVELREVVNVDDFPVDGEVVGPGEDERRMRNVVGFRNEVDRLARDFDLLQRSGAVDDAKIRGIGIVYGAVRRIDEGDGSVGEGLAFDHEAVHGSTVNADAEIFLLIGSNDAFGNHDGSDVGFVGERQRTASVREAENRNRNGELRSGNAFAEADGAVSPPLGYVPLVIEIFEKLHDGMLTADSEFDLDFFERRRHSVLAYVLGDDVEHPLLFVGKHGKIG